MLVGEFVLFAVPDDPTESGQKQSVADA